jgi:hypothetical protein
MRRLTVGIVPRIVPEPGEGRPFNEPVHVIDEERVDPPMERFISAPVAAKRCTGL